VDRASAAMKVTVTKRVLGSDAESDAESDSDESVKFETSRAQRAKRSGLVQSLLSQSSFAALPLTQPSKLSSASESRFAALSRAVVETPKSTPHVKDRHTSGNALHITDDAGAPLPVIALQTDDNGEEVNLQTLDAGYAIWMDHDVLDEFKRRTSKATMANKETLAFCLGRVDVQAKKLRVTMLYFPEQTQTDCTCEPTNLPRLVDIQTRYRVSPLGMVHSHPKHGLFMSSVDLHNSYLWSRQNPYFFSVVYAPTAVPEMECYILTEEGAARLAECKEQDFHYHDDAEDLYITWRFTECNGYEVLDDRLRYRQ